LFPSESLELRIFAIKIVEGPFYLADDEFEEALGFVDLLGVDEGLREGEGRKRRGEGTREGRLGGRREGEGDARGTF
jgi:hypothetical protein